MKQLEFHPLANKYPLITGAAYDEFLASVKAAGKVRVPVVLYEGKILDGRNRYRAGTELGLKVPTRDYAPALDGDDPEQFVENMNDDRRHEEAEIIRRRRQERIKRVTQRKIEGKSNRQIAEEEGISEKTVREDLQSCSGADPGSAPENDPSEVENSHVNGTVKGRDGKTYPAKPKKKAAAKPKEEKTEEAPKKKEPPTVTDAIGLAVPETLKEVFAARALFAEAKKLHRQLTDKLNEIALLEAVSAGHLRKELSRREREGKPYFRYAELESVKLLLDDWIPHVACCPWCLRENDGKPQKTCKACHGKNWIPHRLWRQCSQEDRERVERTVPE